jgi:Fe-S cluster assembly protein SufB
MSISKNQDPLEDADYAIYGFRDPEQFVYKSDKGLNEQLIRTISAMKDEPKWLLNLRLKAFKIFKKKAMPTWGGDLSKIDFDNIIYYGKSTENKANSWDDVPVTIKNTFNKLGIPEAEQKYFGGVGGAV